MLKDYIKNYLQVKTNRSSKSNLIKLLISDPEKFKEINSFIKFGSFKQKLYHFLNDTKQSPHCKICNSPVNWVEKDFCYRETCSSKCSGKLNLYKNSPKKISHPILNTKEEYYEYFISNKIKLLKSSIHKYYPEIINKVENIKITDNFNQKIYCYLKSLNKIPICKNCLSNKTSFESFSKGYRDFCSIKCSSSSQLKKDNIKKTMSKRYNVLNASQIPNQQIFDKYKYTLSNFEIHSYNNSIFNVRHNLCNQNINLHRRIIYDRHLLNTEICTYCNPMNKMTSGYESQISSWLESIGVVVEYSNRKVIKPKEIDIYLPEYRIGIEFNGLYWHSEYHKNKNYHLDKTNLCEKNKISLIHIFEDDWIGKKDIVKSIILNRISKIEKSIYARKCVVKNVPSKESSEFLNRNHIQGSCRSSHKVGLYYNGELVSLMTFGYRQTNSKKEFELIRFCNLLETIVIGGASRLFKHFTKEVKSNIVSYADISMFGGDLYNQLGFKFIHRSVPNYFWVVDGHRHHRWVYNKKNLFKMGYDVSKTEVEIMHELGYYRIYGCGQDRYEYII